MALADLLALMPPHSQAPGQSEPGAVLRPCVRGGFWTAWLILLAIHAAYLAHLLTKKVRPVKDSERCSRCAKAKWDCDCDMDEEPW